MRLRLLVFAVVVGVVVASLAGTADRARGVPAAFGVSGVARTDLGGNDVAWATAVQRNGRIVVAGMSGKMSALARYLGDGRLDPSFGRRGKLLTPFRVPYTPAGAAGSLVLQRDGNLIVAASGDGRFTLVRYLANGRLDSSFGVGGKVLTSFDHPCAYPGWGDNARAVAVQADGKIVAAGQSCADGAFARYLPDGRLDTSFGHSGKLLIPTQFGDFAAVSALALQPDGKVVATIESGPKDAPATIVRLTSRGLLDPSFGRGGRTLIWVADNPSLAAVVIDRHRSVLAVGGAMYESQPPVGEPWSGLALVRLTSSGRLDLHFGNGGKVYADFNSATSAALQADGSVVLAAGRALVRYTAAGVLDTGFANGGSARVPLDGTAAAVVIQSDGKIVVAGNTGHGSKHDFMLTRYDRNGILDS